ncbi:MAG: GNAT family N-acetyltransferase [Proteobacteria bacterium]|nr:GNAT family N-acetyltransferase [Pseudomonadota bacterium]
MNAAEIQANAALLDLSAPSSVPVRIKELAERDRRALLLHFLALDEETRQLRFGSPLPDEQVTRYVQRINFSRDAVFGVYDDSMRLLGVGHLAYLPCDALNGADKNTDKNRVAEFGVSVLAAARGKGIGSKLFERAAMHCRNENIDTLYVHCLSSNRVMLHIAIKAGMQVQRDHGEADACLKLPPPDPASVLREAVDEQVATFDYAYKRNTHAISQWLHHLPGLKLD